MRLIDADKLTKRFKQLKGVDSLANMFITDVVKEIQGQLTVEAVPVVHGELERIPYSFVGGYRCSCCGQKTLERHWNFCPNCGADMRKKV